MKKVNNFFRWWLSALFSGRHLSKVKCPCTIQLAVTGIMEVVMGLVEVGEEEEEEVAAGMDMGEVGEEDVVDEVVEVEVIVVEGIWDLEVETSTRIL